MDGLRLRRRAWLGAAASLLAGRASARLAEAHPLAGTSVALTILGAADWRPSTLVQEMAPGFVAFAKEQYGYDVTVGYDGAPRAGLYDKAVAGFTAKPAAFNVVIADSQWLGAFASQKWILPLNPILEADKALDVDWYAPTVRNAYQLFPDGSNNRWGLPQSGDVLALFVRRDLLTAPGEAEAFKAKYGRDLPQSWEDFAALTWDAFVPVLQFFDRPAQGVRAVVLQPSCVASFMLSRGGRLWDAKSGQVEGVLNTDGNAGALKQYVSLLKFQPADGSATELFTQGKVFSALQWVGAGVAMIPEAMHDAVMVVPPPGFKADVDVVRNYVIGGQVWALNDHNDDAQTLVATDFLRWWYLPQTALEFARRGGLPCDRESVSRADFAGLQPWLRTYGYMLPRSSDVWHDPKYAELQATLHSGVAQVVSGQVTDAKLALDLVACRQQMILFQEGSAERQPGDACRGLQR